MKKIKYRQAIYNNGEFDHWHHWGFMPDLTFVGPDRINGLAHALANSQQFVGIHKGKKVFAGDIFLLNKDDDEWYDVVVWNNFLMRFELSKFHRPACSVSLFDAMTTFRKSSEIVGTIHTHPELLT